MRSRLPSWILLLYLATDFANPFVPGVFRFTPEEGAVWVEAASHLREGVDAVAVSERDAGPAPVPRHTTARGEHRSSGPVRAACHLTVWLIRVRTSDPPARDLPSPDTDDH